MLTDWIIAETGNGLARSPDRAQFAKAVRAIQRSPRAKIIFITPALLGRALELFGSREDKTWGLVDCASFAVMREEGIAEAFTNDRHSAQAGFKNLLPPA